MQAILHCLENEVRIGWRAREGVCKNDNPLQVKDLLHKVSNENISGKKRKRKEEKLDSQHL